LQFFIDNIFLVAAAFVSGALLVWPMVVRGSAARQVNTLGATQLINAEDALFIDIREAPELSKGSVPLAEHIPMSTMDGQMDQLIKRATASKKVRPVIFMCASGWRSARVGKRFRKAGLEQVYSLDGGFDAWRQAGLPVSQRNTKA
jgi:rhodanese-related sulfurtransferase